MELALSRIPTNERHAYKGAFEALMTYKMIGEQAGEFFVTQYGSLFLEFAVPSMERRQLPLTAGERTKTLSFLRQSVSSDLRFDFGLAPLTQTLGTSAPKVSETGDPVQFWIGAAVIGFGVILGLIAIFKR